MTGTVRQLTERDRPAVDRFLSERPVENLYLASRIAATGIDRRRLGKLHGFERDGRLTAVCLDGGTCFPAGIEPEAIPLFVDAIGPIRSASSILGPSMMVLGLFIGLAERWRGAWGSIDNVRKKQPLMVLDRPPAIEADERVRVLTTGDYDSYLSASVQMYTEEIGSSPFKYGRGYEGFVRERLRKGDAYGIVEDGEVIFKADLGPKLGPQAQLQGVWVHPDLRGRGLAAPALSGFLTQVMRRHPVMSLYVNDFNTPALRTYDRLGFRTVGSLSTVHY